MFIVSDVWTVLVLFFQSEQRCLVDFAMLRHHQNTWFATISVKEADQGWFDYPQGRSGHFSNRINRGSWGVIDGVGRSWKVMGSHPFHRVNQGSTRDEESWHPSCACRFSSGFASLLVFLRNEIWSHDLWVCSAPLTGCDNAFSLPRAQEFGCQAQGSPHGHWKAQGNPRGPHAHQGPVDATPACAAAFVEEVPSAEEDRQAALPLLLPSCQGLLGMT